MYGFAEMRNQTAAFLFRKSPVGSFGKNEEAETSYRAKWRGLGCSGRSTEGGSLEQMWAEAMELYRSGQFKLKFSPEMAKCLKEHQRDFMPEDTKAGMIQAYLDSYTGDIVCSKQLYNKKSCIGPKGDHITRLS